MRDRAHVARGPQRGDLAGIDAGRREQRLGRVLGGDAGALEQAPHQREAVRVRPARREGEDRVADLDARAVDDLVALDDPEREAGEVEVVGGVHVGKLGRLAAEQRAAGLPAAVGDALDELGDAIGSEPADGDVVEERGRLGTAAEHVVDAHPDEVDPRIAEAPGRTLQQQLRADAIGAGDDHGIAKAARREQPGEPAEAAEHARRARRGDGCAEPVDDGVGRLERDARVTVGERARLAGHTPTVRSKRSLSLAASPIGTG